ncbi:MAG: hypothetical protein ACAI44_10875, partial [Candidatus Sericytochromatia bacterium]
MDGPRAFAVERAKVEHVPVELSQLPDFAVTPLRIGLDTAQKSARFSLSQGSLWVEGPEGRTQLLADAKGDFEAEAVPGGFALKQNGQSLGRHTGRLVVENQASTLVINGQIYRGGLELMPSPANANLFNVVNPVLLEDYLL